MKKLKQLIKNSDTKTKILTVIIFFLIFLSGYQKIKASSTESEVAKEKNEFVKKLSNYETEIEKLKTEKETTTFELASEKVQAEKYELLLATEELVSNAEEKIGRNSYNKASENVESLDDGYFKNQLMERLKKVEPKVLEVEKAAQEKAEEEKKKEEAERAAKEAQEKKEKDEQKAAEAKKKEEEDNKVKESAANDARLEAGDITYLVDKPSLEQETNLQILAERQFEKQYPYKGSKIHSILGVIQSWTKNTDEWFYKAEATIVNSAGAERKTVVEIFIKPEGPESGIVSILDY